MGGANSKRHNLALVEVEVELGKKLRKSDRIGVTLFICPTIVCTGGEAHQQLPIMI